MGEEESQKHPETLTVIFTNVSSVDLGFALSSLVKELGGRVVRQHYKGSDGTLRFEASFPDGDVSTGPEGFRARLDGVLGKHKGRIRELELGPALTK